jgi:colanic acid/amylovoran biosynthesis glycosyltransferase
LEAAKRLSDKGIDFQLVLAGDGDMRGALESFIKKQRLDQKVRITGWISGEQVRKEIASARALVLPSFAEGLPVVIMEAMASERPVISTFVAGIPELVRQGEDGWLIPAGDVDALVWAMEACLAASDATILKMGAGARTQALNRHRIENEAIKLAALFETCATL